MFPIQITFRDMDAVLAIEELIRERADHLQRFHGRILSCRLVVEPPPRRHRGTTPYRVKVDLSLPGEELVASSAVDAASHADLSVAVRNVFDGITRRLQDFVEITRARPVGAGIGYNLSHVIFDARFTYRAASQADLIPAGDGTYQNLDRWGASARIGYEF